MRRSLLSLIAFALLTSACTNDAPFPEGAGRSPDRPREGKTDDTPGADVVVLDGWTIEVQVIPARVGPLSLATTPVEAAPQNNAKPWARHHLVFRNLGDRPLHFEDTRTSKFLRHRGGRALLAADEGCGYGLGSPGAEPKAGACQAYLDEFEVKPQAPIEREITLFKGLTGMKKLMDGSYEFRKNIRFQVGARGHGFDETVTIRYLIRGEDDS